jgi:hypothetical protein
MSDPSNIPPVSRVPRIAILFVAALLWSGAPVQASVVSGPINSVAYLVKGIVGLPFQILGAAAKGVSKVASKKEKKDEPKK